MSEQVKKPGNRCPVLTTVEGDGHGVDGEGAEQVAAHALLHLNEGAGGIVNPIDRQVLGHAAELGGEVDVADEVRRAGNNQQQILKQAAGGAEQADHLLLAVCAGAELFRDLEELRIVGLPQRGAEQDESLLAARDVSREVDGEGAADGAFSKAGGQGAIRRLELGTALGEQGFKIRGGNCAQVVNHGA